PSIVKHALRPEIELLRPIRAKSLDAVGLFIASRERAHMIFIDGDHSKIGCAIDIFTWRSHLHHRGILAGHDYDRVAHPGVVEAVDNAASDMGVEIERPTRSVWRLQ